MPFVPSSIIRCPFPSNSDVGPVVAGGPTSVTADQPRARRPMVDASSCSPETRSTRGPDAPGRWPARGVVKPRSAIVICCALTIVAALPVTASALLSAARGDTAERRPNILVLISDDQAWSDFSPTLMPAVYSQLVDQGVLFKRAYVNTSLCCPSRSQILTGLYEHHTGVDTNTVPLERPTIVEALHGSGYRTMLAGKYLNSWPCTPRAEFDRWACVG